MSGHQLRRAFLVIPLVLATLAGCKDNDTTAPKLGSNPLFAQGDGGVWTVNSLVDPGDGTCDDADCTLREAVSAASATPGDQIIFVSGLQGTIELSAGPITFYTPMSVDGGGRITLDALGINGVIGVLNLSASTPLVVTLDGLTFTNGSSGEGGGIWAGELTAVTIRNSTVSGNHAILDGGGIWTAGSLTLLNSTIVGNSAGDHGGGIYNTGALAVTGSTISGNVAGDGAAIDNRASATVVRSTISGNHTSDVVGQVRGSIRNDGTLALRSSTVTRNSGELSAPSYALLTWNDSPSAVTLANSIMAGNANNNNCQTTGSTASVLSLGHNLAGAGGGDCVFNASGDVTVDPAQIFTHVLAQDLGDNGGPTMTHALIARGRAIDAGYCPGETEDQRGFARPVDVAAMPNAIDACDIGAYEAQGPQVAVADLMVSQAVDKNSVKQGELLTYTVRVQNLGPQTAPNVVLTNVLSSGVTFVEARQNKGSVTAPPKGETGTVTWSLGDMADQANEIAEIVVTVLVKGKTTITNTATVTGDVADPNEANNTAAITVSVAAGKSGGGKKG